MSEVLRDWGPDKKGKPGPVRREGIAASPAGGRRIDASSNVLTLHAAGDRSAAERFSNTIVTVRDLHSLTQSLADAFFIVVLGVLVGLPFTFGQTTAFESATHHFWKSLIIAGIYLVLERARTKGYGNGVTTRTTRFRDVMDFWTCSFAGLLFCYFALKSSAVLSRAYLITFYVTGLAAFGLWRAYTPPKIAAFSKKFGAASDLHVLIGDTNLPSVRSIAEQLGGGKSKETVVLSLKADCIEGEWANEQLRVLAKAGRALHGKGQGALYLCSAGLTLDRLEALCSSLSILPVATYIVPHPATTGLARCRAVTIGDRVAFELRRPPLSRVQRAAKRVVDVVFGTVALVLLAPVLMIVAGAVRADSKGPIFFLQARSGQGGKPFRIVKFRTMFVMEDGPSIRQASRNDPRVTRVGKFLRASSLDELPQLFNVLKGEMSLVGPRPHALAHDEYYSKEIGNYQLRQHVKPGITGWAQVHGLRGETATIESMIRRIQYDIWYALNGSLLLDFEIMARTGLEIFRRRNAY